MVTGARWGAGRIRWSRPGRQVGWDGGLVTGSKAWRAHLGEGGNSTEVELSRLTARLQESWLGGLSGHHVVASRRWDTEELHTHEALGKC